MQYEKWEELGISRGNKVGIEKSHNLEWVQKEWRRLHGNGENGHVKIHFRLSELSISSAVTGQYRGRFTRPCRAPNSIRPGDKYCRNPEKKI